MTQDTCIFCKIAAGEIPAKTIYEDAQFRAILDLGPATKGHTLILPKNHSANLFELPDEEAAAVMKLAKKLGTKMQKVLKCDGLNLVQNNGEAAGQTVNHFHLHIIPRKNGDDALPLWKPGKSDPDEQKKLAVEIAAHV